MRYPVLATFLHVTGKTTPAPDESPKPTPEVAA
jgi:hypothetical protein